MINYRLVAADEIPIAYDTPVGDLVEIYKVCSAMERICTAENGIGLSAVQIGVPWKLFIMRNGTHYEYFVNCNYIPVSEDRIDSLESCLSLKSDDKYEIRRFEVSRYKHIRVVGQKLDLNPDLHLQDFDEEFDCESNFFAIVMQHEIDHHGNQNGAPMLISEVGREIEVFDGF